MVKRLVDLVLAAIALVAAAPVLVLAAAGIRLASRGPILYRAVRLGQQRRPFVMYKLRTMHVTPNEPGHAITAPGDRRVFRFGAWLRRAKLDELPQCFNVLRGDMSIIGPRPEVPWLVAEYYRPVEFETLAVRPGLSSPGSLYCYTHGEKLLSPADPVGSYTEQLLPLKLALDLVYVRHASLGYDLALIARTAWVLGTALLGRRRFPLPPELRAARRIIQQEGASSGRHHRAGSEVLPQCD
jgi:lipopolysaccharide/colanic/teichoic acid biosynthesis glycosyltransferase